MLSFHNDPTIKEKYLCRVKTHTTADEIVKGQYWENGKGCAVGCTIHGSCHKSYEEELGIPEWLARLEDTLFEHLPNGTARTFPLRFLQAIPIGKNLETVKSKFLIFILQENAKLVSNLQIKDDLKKQVIDAINQSILLHESPNNYTGSAAESAAKSAESAAKSAESAASAAKSAESAAWSAESAESAAWSAAKSAESAASAAWSAESAASAAESAAKSAESAAWSAESAAWSAAKSAESAAWSAAKSAESAAYIKYAEKLIELLSAV